MFFDDWFLKLSPKVTAFFRSEDAMRQDDEPEAGHAMPADQANVWGGLEEWVVITFEAPHVQF